MFDLFSPRKRGTREHRECSRTTAAYSLGRGYWALQFSMSRACRPVRACGRFAWPAWGSMRRVTSQGIVWRGRRRELCAAAEAAGFRGPVRENGCERARPCVRRCESVAGARNPWIRDPNLAARV